MSRAKELKTLTALVKQILISDERTRNSDSFLYFRVLGIIDDKKGVGVYNKTTSEFLLNRAEWGFPPFESVRRARQKIQARHPELSANETVEEFRAENETEFRAFAVAEIN